VEAIERRVKTVVADSQYSSRRVRKQMAESGAVAVIPYPANQRPGEPVLRVDKHFRVHGPAYERRIYGQVRAVIERVNSRLEEQLCLGGHRVRGLVNVTVHVILSIIAMLLVAVASQRLDMPGKVRCIASFWW